MKTAGFVALFLTLQSSLFSQPANFTINGKVLDNKNNPLAYASISAKRTGTMTNKSGEFLIKLPAGYDNDTLHISFLGYESQKLNISSINTSEVLIIKLTEKPFQDLILQI